VFSFLKDLKIVIIFKLTNKKNVLNRTRYTVCRELSCSEMSPLLTCKIHTRVKYFIPVKGYVDISLVMTNK